MDGPVSQANLSDLLVSLKQLIADEESEAADPVPRKKAERLFLDPSLRINAGGQEPAVERIVRTLSLKDKVAKGLPTSDILFEKDNTIKDESLSALLALGFAKKGADQKRKHDCGDRKEVQQQKNDGGV